MRTIPDLVRMVQLADAHLAAHSGPGKAAKRAAREELIGDLADALIEAAGLSDLATYSDVLDIAKGAATVASVNQRLEEIAQERHADAHFEALMESGY